MSRIALDTNAYRLFMEGRPNVVHLIRESDFIGLPVPVIAVPIMSRPRMAAGMAASWIGVAVS